jgi:hypothetical protein
MPRPDEFREMVGTAFVKDQSKTILTIGDQKYDKYSFVHALDCAGSYRAARLLGIALNKLGVKTAKGAETLDVRRLAQIRGVGVTTLYVFLCYLQSQKVKPRTWYREKVGFHAVQRQVRKKKEKPS